MVHETHLLLFETAIMHIIVTCTTFYMTLARMRLWKGWEKSARSGCQIDFKEEDLMKRLGRSMWPHCLYSFRGVVASNVTEPVYLLLRIMFRYEQGVYTRGGMSEVYLIHLLPQVICCTSGLMDYI